MDQRSRGIPREKAYPGSPEETKDPNRLPNSETDPGTDLKFVNKRQQQHHKAGSIAQQSILLPAQSHKHTIN